MLLQRLLQAVHDALQGVALSSQGADLGPHGVQVRLAVRGLPLVRLLAVALRPGLRELPDARPLLLLAHRDTVSACLVFMWAHPIQLMPANLLVAGLSGLGFGCTASDQVDPPNIADNVTARKALAL